MNKVKRFDNVARLGRHVNHDPRSRQFAFDGSKVTLSNAKHKRYIPVLDQGNLGSCTAESGTGLLGTTGIWESLTTGLLSTTDEDFDQKFAVQLYSDATKVDPYDGEYPPTDTGSDGLSVAKVLKSRGLISGYQHTFSIDDCLSALSLQAVMVGVSWYESMFTPDSNAFVSVAAKSKVAGGHEFVLDEINVDKEFVGATNSWGTGWGQDGRFYMTFDTLGRLLGENGDCTVLVPINKPAPVPTPPVPDPGNPLADYPFDQVNPWVQSPHWWHKATVASKALKEWQGKHF